MTNPKSEQHNAAPAAKRIFGSTFIRLALSLLIGLSGLYYATKSGTQPEIYANDFNVYYFAAREVLAGRDPYQNSLGAWTPYLYPPLLAELLIPLALLPLPVAAYLWFILSAASVVLALRLSARLAFFGERGGEQGIARSKLSLISDQKISEQSIITLVTMAVLLRFVLENFGIGQVNTIVTALVIAHIYWYSQEKRFLASLALIFAVAIKLTPAMLLLYHFARRRWRYAFANAALMGGVIALSFLPFGGQAREAFETFYQRTIRNEQKFDLAYSGNQSLRAAEERFKGNTDVHDTRLPIASTAWLFLLSNGLILFWVRRNESLMAALCLSLSVLLSPLSWKPHFVILILPVAILVGEALRERGWKIQYLIIAMLVVGFGLFNLTSHRLIGQEAAEWCDAHSFIFFGALLLHLACAACLLRNRS